MARKGLAVLVVVMAAMLFVGGPETGDSRLVQAIWNLGHIPLFAGLAWLLCTLPALRQRSLWWLLIAVTALALLLGLGIEWLQLWAGRSFDYQDVLRDLAGVYVGLSLHLASIRSRPRPQRLAYAVLAGVIVLVALQPLGVAMLDRVIMRQAFPVLCDFESDRELSRWETYQAEMTRVREPVRQGRQSLRVVYQPGRFSDVSLRDMQSDWRTWRYLHGSVFNSLATPLVLTVKIYDQRHLFSAYHSADRFNRELILQPGWNDLDIDLAEVKTAPADRNMDMASIAGLSFFVPYTAQPVTIYLDDLRLTRG